MWIISIYNSESVIQSNMHSFFTFMSEWYWTERFMWHKLTQNQRGWLGTGVVPRVLLKGVCDKIAFSLHMYFMDCTLSLLFIRSQRKFTKSCQVLFGNSQCCDTAKFLFKIIQWSAVIDEVKFHTTLGQVSGNKL